jgi:hypothetical protein
MNNQTTAIDPFKLAWDYKSYEKGGLLSYDDYHQQVKEFFHKYYVGISDFRGEGKFKEANLMWKIETNLTHKGMIAVLEAAEELLLADVVGTPQISLLDGSAYIIKAEFNILSSSGGRFTLIRDNKNGKLEIDSADEVLKNSIDPEKVVIFYNNEAGLADCVNLGQWTSKLYFFLDQIIYDADKCRKKFLMFTPTRLAKKDWAYFIDGYNNNDIIANVALDNSQKSKGSKPGIDPVDVKYEIYGPESNEREQLWRDYHRIFAEMCKYNGLQYNIGWKEERQNIPEIGLIEAPFRAWEKERKFVREEALKQCEELGWIKEGWELLYGAQAETNEQKINKLEQEIRIIELKKQLSSLRSEGEVSQKKTEKGK